MFDYWAAAQPDAEDELVKALGKDEAMAIGRVAGIAFGKNTRKLYINLFKGGSAFEGLNFAQRLRLIEAYTGYRTLYRSVALDDKTAGQLYNAYQDRTRKNGLMPEFEIRTTHSMDNVSGIRMVAGDLTYHIQGDTGYPYQSLTEFPQVGIQVTKTQLFGTESEAVYSLNERIPLNNKKVKSVASSFDAHGPEKDVYLFTVRLPKIHLLVPGKLAPIFKDFVYKYDSHVIPEKYSSAVETLIEGGIYGAEIISIQRVPIKVLNKVWGSRPAHVKNYVDPGYIRPIYSRSAPDYGYAIKSQHNQ